VKIAATILTIILAFLTVQPVFSTAIAPKKSECCMKDQKCPKPEKNRCDQTACNPLRVCVYGSYFIVESTTTNIEPPIDAAQKIEVVNDNRTFSQLSECWHPPRVA
jgi:hypothetical protein